MTIVSLRVRYASATVDEFIEHHAAEVSPQGICIKTERAIPLGSLIELEVRIRDGRSVLTGAGRVVGMRDAQGATPEEPAAIAVRFIELDDPSTALLERMARERPDAGKKYVELTRSTSRAPPPVSLPAHDEPHADTEGDESDMDATQIGPMPSMPKGRKATLVGLTAPLPPPAAPPRKTPSMGPLPPPTPPPPRVAPAPPQDPPVATGAPIPRGPLPPPRAPESRPAPARVSDVPPAIDEPDEATLIEPIDRADVDAAPVAAPAVSVAPDAEPTVIIQADNPPAEPSPPEPTSLPKLLEVVDVRDERDLGDTQKGRRTRWSRRVLLAGILVGLAGLIVLGFIHWTGTLGTVRGGPLASATGMAAAPPAAGAPPVATSTASAMTNPVEEPPSTTSEPPPVEMEFSALPIGRSVHPPPRRMQSAEPAESAPPATATPSPATAATTKHAAPSPPTSSGGATSDCTPTYTLDTEGNKHFKPWCFGR